MVRARSHLYIPDGSRFSFLYLLCSGITVASEVFTEAQSFC